MWLLAVALFWLELLGQAWAQQAPALPTRDWRTLAFFREEDGEEVFRYCVSANLYDNEIAFELLRREDGFLVLGLSGAAEFAAMVGESGEVRLQVDRGLRRRLRFEVTEAGRLVIPLRQDERLFQTLRAGEVLSVVTAELDPRFVLRGTGVAFAALKRCADSRGTSAGSIRVRENPPSPQPLPLPELVARALHQSGADAIVPLALGSGSSLWGFGRIEGQVQHGKAAVDQSITSAVESYMQLLQRECEEDTGQFLRLDRRPRTVPSGVIAAADVSCTKDDQIVHIALLFYLTWEDLAIFTYRADEPSRLLARQRRDDLVAVVEELILPADSGASGASPP